MLSNSPVECNSVAGEGGEAMVEERIILRTTLGSGCLYATTGITINSPNPYCHHHHHHHCLCHHHHHSFLWFYNLGTAIRVFLMLIVRSVIVSFAFKLWISIQSHKSLFGFQHFPLVLVIRNHDSLKVRWTKVCIGGKKRFYQKKSEFSWWDALMRGASLIKGSCM